MSTHRERARSVISEALQGTEGMTRRAVRAALRKAYSEQIRWPRSGYIYAVWLEEVRFALGERTPTSRRRRIVDPSDIMPSMRQWAVKQGLTQPQAVLDVHQPTQP